MSSSARSQLLSRRSASPSPSEQPAGTAGAGPVTAGFRLPLGEQIHEYDLAAEPHGRAPTSRQQLGAVPVVLPFIETDAEREALLERLDRLVLGVGGDIDPSSYGGRDHPSLTSRLRHRGRQRARSSDTTSDTSGLTSPTRPGKRGPLSTQAQIIGTMAPTIQHVALTVSNPERSAAYFTAALSVFEPKSRPALYTSDRGERPRVVAIEHSLSIMLHPAEDVTAAVDRYRAGSLHHLAIEVATIELVDRIAASAREAGGRVTDGPRQFPEYRFGYYGVFLRDPDDIKWEVFCYPLLKQ